MVADSFFDNHTTILVDRANKAEYEPNIRNVAANTPNRHDWMATYHFPIHFEYVCFQ